MKAECGHPAAEMVCVDGEPLDERHTRWVFRCAICGATERIVECHEAATGLGASP